MVSSLHELQESVYNGRRYSTNVLDGNLRTSIDENSSYDDLLKVRTSSFFISSIKNHILGNYIIT